MLNLNNSSNDDKLFLALHCISALIPKKSTRYLNLFKLTRERESDSIVIH